MSSGFPAFAIAFSITVVMEQSARPDEGDLFKFI